MDPQDLIDTRQAAELLPWSIATLRRWRSTWPAKGCKGPKFMTIEGRVFYERGVVLEWLKHATRGPAEKD